MELPVMDAPLPPAALPLLLRVSFFKAKLMLAIGLLVLELGLAWGFYQPAKPWVSLAPLAVFGFLSLILIQPYFYKLGLDSDGICFGGLFGWEALLPWDGLKQVQLGSTLVRRGRQRRKFVVLRLSPGGVDSPKGWDLLWIDWRQDRLALAASMLARHARGAKLDQAAKALAGGKGVNLSTLPGLAPLD